MWVCAILTTDDANRQPSKVASNKRFVLPREGLVGYSIPSHPGVSEGPFDFAVEATDASH